MFRAFPCRGGSASPLLHAPPFLPALGGSGSWVALVVGGRGFGVLLFGLLGYQVGSCVCSRAAPPPRAPLVRFGATAERPASCCLPAGTCRR